MSFISKSEEKDLVAQINRVDNSTLRDITSM